MNSLLSCPLTMWKNSLHWTLQNWRDGGGSRSWIATVSECKVGVGERKRDPRTRSILCTYLQDICNAIRSPGWLALVYREQKQNWESVWRRGQKCLWGLGGAVGLATCCEKVLAKHKIKRKKKAKKKNHNKTKNASTGTHNNSVAQLPI